MPEEIEEIKFMLSRYIKQPLVWYEEGSGFYYLEINSGDEIFIGKDFKDFWENFG